MPFRDTKECVCPNPNLIDGFLFRARFHRGDGKGPQTGFVHYYAATHVNQAQAMFDANFPFAQMIEPLKMVVEEDVGMVPVTFPKVMSE